jgi:hypothetical protein
MAFFDPLASILKHRSIVFLISGSRVIFKTIWSPAFQLRASARVLILMVRARQPTRQQD